MSDGDNDTKSVVVRATQADVQAIPPSNAAPKFSEDFEPNTPGKQADATLSVAENEDVGTSVGTAIIATDSDSNEKLIYTLSGADAASFTVVSGLEFANVSGTGQDGNNAKTGEGQIKTAVKLDYETKNQYMVVLTATDPSGATGSVNVIINVTDVDDAPSITPLPAENTAPAFDMDAYSFTVDENMAAGTSVGTVTATDEEGEALTYTIDGTSFAIDAMGEITTTVMLDYETAMSHTATVTASDGENTADVTVTITVGDVSPGCTAAGNTGLTNDCETLLAGQGRAERQRQPGCLV